MDITKHYWIKATKSNQYLTALGNSVAFADLATTDLKQQWKFIAKDADYYIQSAAQNQPTLHLYAETTASETPAVLKQNQDQWKVTIINNNQGTLTATIAYVGGQTTYLTNAGKPVFTPIPNSDREWLLIPASGSAPGPGPGPGPGPVPVPGTLVAKKNPLPDGQYRIRSYDSKLLLTMGDNEPNVYVTHQGSPSDPSRLLKRQEWSVKFDSASRSYEVISGSNNHHLSVSGASADGVPLVGQRPSPHRWLIQALDMGVMFVIGVMAGTQPYSIGFADYRSDDNDQVVLKPSDNVPSQIWFFEKAHPILVDKFVAGRYDLRNGDYYIRNCSNGLYMDNKSGTGLILSTQDRQTDPSKKFTLEFMNSTGPNFTLRQGNAYLVASGNQVVLLQNPGTFEKQWVALLHPGESEPRYYISRPTETVTGSPAVVTRSLGQQNQVAMEIRDGQIRQMWNFRISM